MLYVFTYSFFFFFKDITNKIAYATVILVR